MEVLTKVKDLQYPIVPLSIFNEIYMSIIGNSNIKPFNCNGYIVTFPYLLKYDYTMQNKFNSNLNLITESLKIYKVIFDKNNSFLVEVDELLFNSLKEIVNKFEQYIKQIYPDDEVVNCCFQNGFAHIIANKNSNIIIHKTGAKGYGTIKLDNSLASFTSIIENFPYLKHGNKSKSTIFVKGKFIFSPLITCITFKGNIKYKISLQLKDCELKYSSSLSKEIMSKNIIKSIVN